MPYETSPRVEDIETRSQVLNAVIDAGGPVAAAVVAKQAIKTTGEVITAKINAQVEIIKAVNNPGTGSQE
jgi:hypothetical protein